jgi:hypothetical protein
MAIRDLPAPEVPLTHADYSAPTLECDIVMKGGITSGVVYPLAVCELARDYRFRCIGGTSAGAIAAAATAAAEYGRRNGGSGFNELAQLPGWLGDSAEGADRSNLFALFQPQPATDAIFDVATASMRGKSIPGRLVQRFPLAALLGAVPGAAAVWLATQARPAGAAIALGIAGVLLAAAGALGMAGWMLARQVRKALPENGFGLCSGDGAGLHHPSGQAPALTPWLAGLLNGLAGKPADREPLTFGDLWGPGDRVEDRVTDLRFMTTNLTHGRPYELPLDSREFYYDSAEFRKLFPGWVVDWMDARSDELAAERRAEARLQAEKKARKAAARARESGADVEDDEDDTMEAELSDAERADARAASRAQELAREQWKRLRPLPADRHLPVVVAARMSLSFPVLISAVPLYAVDFTRKRPREQHYPERCWFSDGGICSNFPVHFFDAPLPTRPTFAINLRTYHPDYRAHPDESRNSWTPGHNRGGQEEWWTRFDAEPGWKALGGFAGAILNAVQNWVDNTQLRVPGYRDRVVHVSLDETEGGLNLNMPPALIARLGTRGQLAAAKLARRFGPGDGTPLTWDNHRWVRLLSSMQLLEELLREVTEEYDESDPSGRTYADLVTRRSNEPPPSYRIGVEKAKELDRAIRDLQALGFLQGEPLLTDEVPNPVPELRIRPRL